MFFDIVCSYPLVVKVRQLTSDAARVHTVNYSSLVLCRALAVRLGY